MLPTAPGASRLDDRPAAAFGVLVGVPLLPLVLAGVAAAEPSAAMALRDASAVKSTVMEAFLHSERVGAVPVLKFTAAHFSGVSIS